MDKQLRGTFWLHGFMGLEQYFGIRLTFIYFQLFYVFQTEVHPYCTRQVQTALPSEWLFTES